ncbi:extracellular solute-binding protein [Paenibacillus aurantius]|nr:extracellular solute-binding protein [Paenibacillus aurantius]
MKKWISSLVIPAMAAAALTGCSGKTPGETAKGQEGQSSPSAAPKEVAYPAKLSYWVAMNANVAATMKSFNEMGVYQELQKRTGTVVDFQHPPVGQHNDQFNLLLASGQLPDVIEHTWAAVSKGPDNAIKEKKILRLNELIDAHAPNLSKILKDDPELKKQIMTDEGNIYVFPYFSKEEFQRVYNGPAIRKDWLDKLKLPVPQTIDEWEKTLTAIRDGDPNGNGKKDEVPLLLDLKVMDFGHAFIGAYGITSGFYQDQGKVKFGPIQPEFKEFLTVMNRWYKEGLIDKDFATMDQKLKDAKMTGNLVGAMAMNVGAGLGSYTSLMKPKYPDFNLVGVPYPALKQGGMSVGQMNAPFIGTGAAISANAKNPEQIVKWLDYAYGPEGHLLFNYGIEGQSYTMVNGKPTLTKEITTSPTNLPVSQAIAKYSHGSFSGPYVVDKGLTEQFSPEPFQKQAIETWMKADHAKLLPSLTLTSQESSEMSSSMNDIKTYYSEMVNKFIMGMEPIDSFDKYVGTIQKMGIDKVIQTQQKALERLNKRS